MLVEKIQKGFQQAANSTVASQQKAYMRNQFEFLGLKTEVRRLLQKELFLIHPIQDKEDLFSALQQLWALPEREYQYCAIDLAKKHLKGFSAEALVLFEGWIREKSWWDTVDDLAINLVGHKKFTNNVLPLMDVWVEDPYLWIRRTAIICQIKWKKETDTVRLFSHCRRLGHETDFFIRKAIGWALREYAKHDREAVREFLQVHEGRFSGLTVREATKHFIGTHPKQKSLAGSPTSDE